MIINLYNLINDENEKPKLNVINSIEYDSGPELITPYDTIPLLCKLSGCHKSHVENAYMSTYNHKGQLNGFFYLASGKRQEVNPSDRIKATYLILSGGFSFEIFHNHPVDDNTPSEGDETSTYLEGALASYLEAEYINDYVISRSGWTCVNTKEHYDFSKMDLDFINE